MVEFRADGSVPEGDPQPPPITCTTPSPFAARCHWPPRRLDPRRYRTCAPADHDALSPVSQHNARPDFWPSSSELLQSNTIPHDEHCILNRSPRVRGSLSNETALLR
ncbi:hypothetical protein PsYK624_027710 [Phanerochaete sordida]|uniref:Uncharacterized protein n=1 Tax=Phanerochaete sordida TaxID=48140 RepID=A0A9P3G2H2_9APHY|nr:hypothetical protein PsYK624_027710 [Phanerochaete sordida]